MNVSLSVQNFGPIEKAEIDMRPLTVFVGESNTGKTYLAALLYALHQHFGGFPQFPEVDTVASYFRYAYRSMSNYPQNRRAKVEEELLELFAKLNTPSRPFTT